MTDKYAGLIRMNVVDAIADLEAAIQKVSVAQQALARAGCVVSIDVKFKVLTLKPRALRAKKVGKRATMVISEGP